jgi:hypothetical protein
MLDHACLNFIALIDCAPSTCPHISGCAGLYNTASLILKACFDALAFIQLTIISIIHVLILAPCFIMMYSECPALPDIFYDVLLQLKGEEAAVLCGSLHLVGDFWGLQETAKGVS